MKGRSGGGSRSAARRGRGTAPARTRAAATTAGRIRARTLGWPIVGGLDGARGLTLVTLTLVLLLAPLTAGIPLTEDQILIYRVIVVPSDLPLLALIVVVAVRLARGAGRPRVRPGAALLAALVATLALSFLPRATPIGAQTVFRMTGALAVAIAVADLARPAERTFVAAVLAGIAAVESALAVAQAMTGTYVGLIGEAPAPILEHGASFIPRGTFLHPYPLAGFGMVVAVALLGHGLAARRLLPWSLAAAVAVVPVGISYSRAALLGIVGGLAVVGGAGLRRPVYRWAAAALLVGAAVPALIWNDAWIARTEERDTSLAYRELLQDEAFAIVAAHPLEGVGTGRYIAEARELFPHPPRPLQPVHSVPLIVLAEAGIVGGLLCVTLLAALALRAAVAGAIPTALFLVFAPYVVFDVFPYVGWQGPAILGLWIGLLDRADLVARPARPGAPLRVLAVIPGDEAGPSMIHAKRQVASLREVGVDCRAFFLRERMSPLGILGELLRLRRRVSDDEPDLVHAQYGTVTAFIAAVATTAPLVITFRGSDLNPVRGYPRARVAVAHLLSQLAALRASRILCMSEELRSRLWWRREVAVVMPSGVDLRLFAPRDRAASRRALGWDPGARIVLFNAGRDPVLKRVDIARAALERARGRIPGLQMIELDGSVDPSLIPAMMNAADCLLLTSDREGSPTVVQEAIACGLPVVTVDVGDVGERLSGVVPSAVVAQDPAALGRALIDLLAEPRRSNGPRLASAFSLRILAERLRDAYARAVGP
jgi:glycosyltransferase involved in cell wall biosynthesis